jgi:hypothetical protein
MPPKRNLEERIIEALWLWIKMAGQEGYGLEWQARKDIKADSEDEKKVVNMREARLCKKERVKLKYIGQDLSP